MIALTETDQLTMFKPKVSLVFPCWHVSQHMEHVLEDLQAQTFKDFEAVLVNDGDDSQVEAMEAIAAQDSRIRIVSLSQNSGVAAARNAGTDAVTTEWVTYPDPDDRFGPFYVKSLHEAVDGTGVDMACGGFSRFIVENGGICQQFIMTNGDPKIMDFAAGYEQMLQSSVFTSAWNKLYNVGIIRNNHLRQESHFKIGQDYAFNMKYFPFCKKVGLVGNCGYIYYHYQHDSNSKRFHPHFFKYRLEIIGLRDQFHRHIGWSELKRTEIQKKELCNVSFNYVKQFYTYNTRLPLSIVAKDIQKNILSHPDIVNAILQTNSRNDYIMRIFRFLTKMGSARIMAITFSIMFAARRRFARVYTQKRNLLRGGA